MLGRAKSPKVNDVSSSKEPKSTNNTAVDAATSDLDIVQQSTVVQTVDPAYLSDTGKTLSNSNTESTEFNHELHALLQHVYSEVPLDINFGISSGEALSYYTLVPPNNEVLLKVIHVAFHPHDESSLYQVFPLGIHGESIVYT